MIAESAVLGASRRIALAVAAATATTGAVFVVDPFDGLGGLWQRVAVLVPLTWLVVVAGRAGRHLVSGSSNDGATAVGTAGSLRSGAATPRSFAEKALRRRASRSARTRWSTPGRDA